MQYKKKNYFLFILLIVVSSQVTQNIISSEVMNVAIDMKTFPVGDNFASITNNTGYVNYNIAGIGNTEGGEIDFEYINFIADTFLANAYFIYPLRFVNICIKFGYFDSGKVEQRSAYSKDIIGTYSVSNYIVAVALAKNVNRRFLYGVGVKLLTVGAYGISYNKNIVVFDCGVMHIFPLGGNNLCISAAGNNLPSQGRISLACAYNVRKLGLTIYSDLDYFLSYKATRSGLGSEITFIKNIIVLHCKADIFNFSYLDTFSYDITLNFSPLLRIKKEIVLSFGHTWAVNFNNFISKGSIGVKF
jgi:hypothetical protein